MVGLHMILVNDWLGGVVLGAVKNDEGSFLATTSLNLAQLSPHMELMVVGGGRGMLKHGEVFIGFSGVSELPVDRSVCFALSDDFRWNPVKECE